MRRYLIDTNVLVYALDASDPAKQARSVEVLARTGGSARGVIPVQALAELARVCLTKLEPPLPADELFRQIELYERSFPVVPLTAPVVLEAVRGVRDHQFSYFDAQIWAAARLNQFPAVLSEDFASGSVVEGVTFLNPFAEGFDLDRL